MNWRGVFGKDFEVKDALEIGQSLGGNGAFLVGSDTRFSSLPVKMAVETGLLAAGSNIADVGLIGSPVLARVCRLEKLHGVVVTGSHRSPEFVGIKVFDKMGREISAEVRDAEPKTNGVIGRYSQIDVIPAYLDDIAEDIQLEGDFDIVLDPANSVMSLVMPNLLRSAGNSVAEINSSLSPFPARPFEPTRESLRDLALLVKRKRADLGVGYDGDGDRAVFVDETGKVLDSSKILAIITEHKGAKKIVTDVSTSSILDYVAKEVIRVPVGERHIAQKLLDTGAELGGDSRGGFIFPGWSFTRDGAKATLEVLRIMENTGMSLKELVDELPERELLRKEFRIKKPERVVEKARKNLSIYELDLTDGVKAFIDDGWALVRAEDGKVQVIAEGPEKADAEKYLSEACKAAGL